MEAYQDKNYKEKYITVCNKKDILLQVDKSSKTFTLEFKSENKNFNFNELLSFNIYNLMEKLNKDLIESIEILKIYSENEIDVLFKFKKIGAEIGLAQKYMALKTIKTVDGNNIYFNSINLAKSLFDNSKIPQKSEPLICEMADLTIFNTHLKTLDLYYKFKIDTNEDLPIYMENYVGLMMKKIFYNLKVFIDNFSN